MSKVLDCHLEVIEYELQSHYGVHFRTNTLGKGTNSPPYPPRLVVKISLLFFYKAGFGVK